MAVKSSEQTGASQAGSSAAAHRRGMWWLGIAAFGLPGVLVGFAVGLVIFGSPLHLPPAWGDIPTWLTAAFTALLAVFAIVTAWYAREAFRQQSVEVRDLLQERRREAEERRRAQASMVFVSYKHSDRQPMGQPQQGRATMYVKNTSEQPIYELRFAWPGFHEELTIREQPLMPGEQDGDFRPVAPGPGNPPACAAIFRDRDEIWWRADSGGKLVDLGKHEAPPRW
jgi:hypothetical protein